MIPLRKSFTQAAAWIQDIFQHDWAFFGGLLLVMAAAYAIKISSLGFYWDDWEGVFNSRFAHLADYWNFYLNNRPTGAWVYVLGNPLLGVSPLPWQIASLLVRWVGTLALYLALKGVWSGRAWAMRWMALLLVVYPGFVSQSISVAYLQHWSTFAMFTLSLWAMVAGLRNPKRFWLLAPLAWLACLVHVFTMEYFIGLELLRLAILWFVLQRNGEKWTRTASKVFKLWAPYLAIILIFVVWRFVYFPKLLPGPDPNSPELLLLFLKAPLAALQALTQAILQDSVYLLIFAWANTVQTSTINLGLLPTLYSWAIGLVLAALLAWALVERGPLDTAAPAGLSSPPEPERPDAFAGQAALLGVLGILGGGLPVWLLGSQVIYGKWADRYALAPMIGVVILIICLLEWLAGVGKTGRKSFFLALLLGFSIAAQIRVTNLFRRDWQIQRNFYWQIYWRMPALKPGTAVLGAQMPLNYSSVYAIGLALNLIYAPTRAQTAQLTNWFIDGPRYHGSSRLPDYEENLPIKYVMRSLVFQGNTSQAVVVDFDSSKGCVYALMPDDDLRPGTSDDQARLYQISHLDQIETDPAKAASMPAAIFGAEPPHTWCYYYEKADLARQMGDWQAVADLDQAAGEAGYSTRRGVELVPFIEAYAHLGQWQTAYQYTLSANQKSGEMQPFLCQAWERITKETSPNPEREQVVAALDQKLKCK